MTTNLKMIERLPLEVLNKGSVELVDEILSTDYVDHSVPAGMPKTREGFKQTVLALRKAFPDLHYTIDDAIESGDRIVHRLTASGTMKGDLQGMAATGKRATWTEIHIGRIANGRLVEHWGLVNQLDMLVQLGIVPAPGRVPATV
jgi:predicted ester cyclase